MRVLHELSVRSRVLISYSYSYRRPEYYYYKLGQKIEFGAIASPGLQLALDASRRRPLETS